MQSTKRDGNGTQWSQVHCYGCQLSWCVVTYVLIFRVIPDNPLELFTFRDPKTQHIFWCGGVNWRPSCRSLVGRFGLAVLAIGRSRILICCHITNINIFFGFSNHPLCCLCQWLRNNWLFHWIRHILFTGDKLTPTHLKGYGPSLNNTNGSRAVPLCCSLPGG